jgi:plasmid stabilization system protein ParE
MTGSRFVLTPEAREDLLEIWSYIATDSFDRADEVLDKLYDAFVRLSQAPGIGHQREDLADQRHRFWNVYSYVPLADATAPDPFSCAWSAASRSVASDENRRSRDRRVLIFAEIVWQNDFPLTI